MILAVLTFCTVHGTKIGTLCQWSGTIGLAALYCEGENSSVLYGMVKVMGLNNPTTGGICGWMDGWIQGVFCCTKVNSAVPRPCLCLSDMYYLLHVIILRYLSVCQCDRYIFKEFGASYFLFGLLEVGRHKLREALDFPFFHRSGACFHLLAWEATAILQCGAILEC